MSTENKNTLPQEIIHEGKLYAVFEHPWFCGYTPSDKKVTSLHPFMQYKGGKMPYDEWQRVVSFLRWTQDEFGSEAMMNFYLNEKENKLFAVPVPQKVGTGMTVSTLSREEAGELWAKHYTLSAGWEPLGTIHHHCKASAFQSSTDSADEITKPGLHVTIGNLDKDRLSIHARVCVLGTFYQNPPLLEWIEPKHPEIMDCYPGLAKSMFETDILEAKPVSFPEEWKEFCQKISSTSTRDWGGHGGWWGDEGYYGGNYHYDTAKKLFTPAQSLQRLTGTHGDVYYHASFVHQGRLFEVKLDSDQYADALKYNAIFINNSALSFYEYYTFLQYKTLPIDHHAMYRARHVIEGKRLSSGVPSKSEEKENIHAKKATQNYSALMNRVNGRSKFILYETSKAILDGVIEDTIEFFEYIPDGIEQEWAIDMYNTIVLEELPYIGTTEELGDREKYERLSTFGKADAWLDMLYTAKAMFENDEMGAEVNPEDYPSCADNPTMNAYRFCRDACLESIVKYWESVLNAYPAVDDTEEVERNYGASI